MLRSPGASARVILLLNQKQNGSDLFWNIEAVKSISKRNLGRQTFWFENSFPSETKNERSAPPDRRRRTSLIDGGVLNPAFWLRCAAGNGWSTPRLRSADPIGCWTVTFAYKALQTGAPAKVDDLVGRRVSTALSACTSCQTVSSHPPLWSLQQPAPCGKPHPLPRTAEHAGA